MIVSCTMLFILLLLSFDCCEYFNVKDNNNLTLAFSQNLMGDEWHSISLSSTCHTFLHSFPCFIAPIVHKLLYTGSSNKIPTNILMSSWIMWEDAPESPIKIFLWRKNTPHLLYMPYQFLCFYTITLWGNNATHINQNMLQHSWTFFFLYIPALCITYFAQNQNITYFLFTSDCSSLSEPPRHSM